jgi:hypothetical protein
VLMLGAVTLWVEWKKRREVCFDVGLASWRWLDGVGLKGVLGMLLCWRCLYVWMDGFCWEYFC